MWGVDWKFRPKGNCSASRGLPNDAEQLSLVTEFSVCTSQPLWILFLAYRIYSYNIVFILINTPSPINAPLPFFMGKRLPKCHTNWLQDIEILVHLPTFCFEKVIFRTSELQCPQCVYLNKYSTVPSKIAFKLTYVLFSQNYAIATW